MGSGLLLPDLPAPLANPGGWTQLADGRWAIQTTDVRQLSVTTPATFAGAMVLDMTMSWTKADGSVQTMSIANNIEAFALGNPILAWSGDDHLTGAAGVADSFVVAQPVGNVAIYSFEAIDKINMIGFEGLDSFDKLAIAGDSDGNAVITLADGSSITVVGVSAAQLTQDNFVFNEVPELKNKTTIEIGDGAMLPLSGLVNNAGTIEMNSDGDFTLLELIRDGIELDGGGEIVMSDSNGNVIMGTSADIVLTNVDNTISGAGHIGYGSLTLVNHGLIVATGTHSLEIDTGLNAVVNTGTLQSTGGGGLNVHSDVVNDGLIWAYGGDVTTVGTVSGSGSAMISGSATLTFGAAAAIDVEFAADAAGTLELGDAFNFDGLISGLDGDDRLVLRDFAFSSDMALVYMANEGDTGGTLTLSDGAQDASIGLLGQYDASWFQFEEDENGGTVVTYAEV